MDLLALQGGKTGWIPVGRLPVVGDGDKSLSHRDRAGPHRLLVGALKFDYLVLCKVEGNTITVADVIFEEIGRVRNVRQAPDGYLYIATEDDAIKRIVD